MQNRCVLDPFPFMFCPWQEFPETNDRVPHTTWIPVCGVPLKVLPITFTPVAWPITSPSTPHQNMCVSLMLISLTASISTHDFSRVRPPETHVPSMSDLT